MRVVIIADSPSIKLNQCINSILNSTEQELQLYVVRELGQYSSLFNKTMSQLLTEIGPDESIFVIKPDTFVPKGLLEKMKERSEEFVTVVATDSDLDDYTESTGVILMPITFADEQFTSYQVTMMDVLLTLSLRGEIAQLDDVVYNAPPVFNKEEVDVLKHKWLHSKLGGLPSWNG